MALINRFVVVFARLKICINQIKLSIMNQFRQAFLVLVLLHCCNLIVAQCMIEVPLQNRSEISAVIVEGTVTSQFCFWDDNQSNIYTAHKIQVFKSLKGNITDEYIELITGGGTIGLQRQTIQPNLTLKIGDVGVFFLRDNNISAPNTDFESNVQFKTTSGPQSFIKYDERQGIATDPFATYDNPEIQVLDFIQAQTGQIASNVMLYDFSDTVAEQPSVVMSTSITSFSPSGITAGMLEVLTIQGTDFGTSGTVRFANCDDGGATYIDGHASEIISWSNTTIEVLVNARAGSGTVQVVGNGTATSSEILFISTAQHMQEFDGEMYQTRHADVDGNGGYIWQMQTDFHNNSDARASCIRALDTWRCSSVRVFWELGSVTTTDEVANDGVNIIRFDNGDELDEGVLAAVWSHWDACISVEEGEVVVRFYVKNIDMFFDDDTNWNYGPNSPVPGEFDFESVALHEFGHAMQLNHVNNLTDPMYYAYSAGAASEKRNLNFFNLLSGMIVHQRSTDGMVCDLDPMSNFCCPANDTDGDGVCDGYEVEGCTDPSACNYNEDGSCTYAVDGFDCDGNCLEGSNVTLTLYDSWGDSWNGNSLTINGVVYEQPTTSTSSAVASDSYTLCLDLSTCITVTYNLGEGNTYPDDNSWSLSDASGELLASGGAASGTVGTCCEGSDVTLTLYDSWGDGGGSVTINGDTYTLGGGASDDFTLCLDLSVCTEVLYAATDSWGYENSWALYIPDGLLASGEAESGTVGTCIDGCTDATACNYDDTANNEDDSCTYAEQYYDCMGDCINDSDGDGVCDELEIAGCVVPGACNYAIGVTDLAPCVYPDPGYLCDGTCDGDADGDGVCDDNEILGCQDATACNYNADATESDTCDYTTCLGCTDASACNYDATSTQEDGSCDYCSCDNAGGGQDGFGLELDAVSIDGSLTTYRLYVTTPDAGDFVSSISGNVNNPSFLRTTTSFAQSAVGGLTADLVNPLFFSSFPDLATDSWLTIGIDQAPAAGEGSISTAVAAGDTWGADFEAGGNLEINSFFGGSWFALNNVTNGFAGADNRVLVAQLTTDGNVTGSLYTQIFPGGDSSQELLLNLTFGATGCGCTDATACNYDATASYDDNDSCGYAEAGYDCDGNCLVDTDGDGVCDEFEVPGCMDTTACNYDEFADNDDSSCYYLELTDLPGGAPACGLFFSGYAEGSSNNKFLEIYNPTDSDISLDGYAYPSVTNGPTNPGEHETWNTFPAGAVVAAGDVYVVSHGSADPAILPEADEFHTYLSNGDDGYALVQGDESSYVIVDMIGTWDADPGSGWEVAGVANGTKDHSLIRKSDVISGNAGDWAASAGTDTDDSEWIVLDQNDWTGLGSHDFTGSCGGGAQAYVYDCDGACFNDADGDGVCDELEVAGCTDSGACNYDAAATDEDSSCEYLTCAGCTDATACNYDDAASIEDASCWYAEQFQNCDGSCINDINVNGICDEIEIEGCTYADACNYDFEANVEDGSCDFACLTDGCTDSGAVNYNDGATEDDDSCLFIGCMDEGALNYDAAANLDCGCQYPDACPGDFNDDNEVDVSDLLDFFQLWGNVCN